MKRFCSLFLALLLIIGVSAKADASDGNRTPLQFGDFEGIYTIYAAYRSDAPADGLSVKFRDDVEAYSLSNFKNGVLMIAVVSTEELDLSTPVAWVTQAGSGTPPTLIPSALRLNEVPVETVFTASSLEATVDNGKLSASAEIQTPEPMTCTVVTAAYKSGQMLGVDCRTMTLSEPHSRVQTTLSGCAGATEIKMFFLSTAYTPLGTALRQDLTT